MSQFSRNGMTKDEVAHFLGVTNEDIQIWSQFFSDWLDVCSMRTDKVHDENDVLIFSLINTLNNQIDKDIPFAQRIHEIKQGLFISEGAILIRRRRMSERNRPVVARWQIVDSAGICLKYDYEWLRTLTSNVSNIVDFGCWVPNSDAGTCSESFALLWTLDASRVVVVDKQREYIQNAQSWLRNTRREYTFFNDYQLDFITGDMTDEDLSAKIISIKGNRFELAYCNNVLYNIFSDPSKLKVAIRSMVKVLQVGGWAVAVEPKMGVEYEKRQPESSETGLALPIPVTEPVDISNYFEDLGLKKYYLEGAPDYSYCYQK
jgi:hypothetical protein